MTGAVIWHIVIVSSLPPIQKDEVYLNLVLDFVPETVYRVARHFNKAKSIIPIIYVKVNCLALLFTCSLLLSHFCLPQRLFIGL